ncbi:MAG: uroporphyrinogen decarboxylase [Rhodospirillales bacterium]
MTPSSHVKPLLQALAGQVLTRPPFWLMRQAGRYLPEYREVRERTRDFLDLCYSPELAAEVTLQPLRRFRMDAAILFSDILMVPDALGQKVAFRDGEGPVLEPLRSIADVKRLKAARLEGHLAPVFETLRRVRAEIPPETTLIGFAGAPWTVAVYMVEGRGGTDCRTVRTWAEDSPDEFQVLTDVLVDATSRYLAAQVESGAEVIQIFDSWAGVLEEELFRRWIVEPTRRIVDHLHEHCPGVPVIGFPRGAGALTEDYVDGTGVEGISLDQDAPLDWIAGTLQSKCTVQGNLDNEILVTGGAALDRETARILKALSGGPFIFNLGHGVLPATPPEHVARLAELVLGWPATAEAVA